MTLPVTPDLEILNFETFGTLTEVGAPTYADDAWGGRSIVLDGVSDGAFVPPVMTTGDQNYTCSCYITPSAALTASVLFGQINPTSAATRGDGSFYARFLSDKLESTCDGVTGADITRSISDDAVTTNQLIHVAVTRENVGTSTIMKVFHNGVEVSYQAGEQDRDFNNGSSVIGTKANAQNFYIGQFSTNIQRYAGEIARMKFWVNTAGTPAEISEEFNSEQALLNGGVGILPNILDPILDPILQRIF